MLNPIQTIRNIEAVARPGPASPGSSASGDAFSGLFESAIASVQSTQQAASKSIERMLSGEPEEVHQTMLSAQRAELAFEMFLQVRNKVLQAYQEVMRMQV